LPSHDYFLNWQEKTRKKQKAKRYDRFGSLLRDYT